MLESDIGGDYKKLPFEIENEMPGPTDHNYVQLHRIVSTNFRDQFRRAIRRRAPVSDRSIAP